jgi:hypothetical protein
MGNICTASLITGTITSVLLQHLVKSGTFALRFFFFGGGGVELADSIVGNVGHCTLTFV